MAGAVVTVRRARGAHLSPDARSGGSKVEEGYERSLRFLAFRPRSVAEVRGKLARAGYDSGVVEAVILRLKGERLLDDQQFAAYWVEQRQTFHPRGVRALRAELRQKGLDAACVSEALAPCMAEEDDAAYRAGLRQARHLRSEEEPGFARALSTYLARRGFGWSAIRSSLPRLWEARAG